jgi:protocatechuate 3,4-dioxygenase beta subunit
MGQLLPSFLPLRETTTLRLLSIKPNRSLGLKGRLPNPVRGPSRDRQFGDLLARLLRALGAVVLIASCSHLVAQQASADPSAVVSVTQSISVKGASSSNGVTAWPYYQNTSGGPDESTITVSILVQCAGSEPCREILLQHVVPAGLSIYSAPQGAISMLQSYTVTPTGFTYVLKEMAPGFSGVIDLKAQFNSYTTPNGKIATFEASATGSNVAAVLANPVTATAVAANTTSVNLVKAEGGAVGGRLGLTASRCVTEFPRDFQATAGRLAVAENNKLVVNIPVGGEPDPTTAGVWNPIDRTLTLTGSLVAANCYPQLFLVRFPADNSPEHATNVVGATKFFTASWVGHSVGETTDRTLGTKNLTLQLGPELIAGEIQKIPGGDGVRQVVAGEPDWVYQPGNRITYAISALNSNENLFLSKWNQIEITDAIPLGLRIERYQENFLSQRLTSLTFTTDAHPTPIVIVNPGFSVNFYDAAYGIAAADRVRTVKFVGISIEPGQWTGPILEGVVESDVIDKTVITNTANFVLTGETTTKTGSASSSVIVKTRIPTYEFVPYKGVQSPSVWPAPLEPTFYLQANSTADPILDPVVVDVLPAGMEFTGFRAASPNLPDPTLTKTLNWNGTGETLLVWRYPSGTVLPPNSRLGFDLATRFGASAPAAVTNRLYIGSTAVTVFCGGLDPAFYFEGSGFLGDGITRRYCKTYVVASRPPGTSIEVSASAKGSLDNSFVPGPGLAKGVPGGVAKYQLQASNTGEAALTGVTLIDVLPRPGDSSIVSTRRRNTATNTFPVSLTGVPTSSVPIVVSWTSESNICQVELDYFPVGCVSPSWALLTASTELSAITAIKIVFGGSLSGGESWSVDVPVAIPATAISGQTSYNSVALAATRLLTGTQLLSTESYRSGLTVPSGTGSIGDRLWEDTNGNGVDDLGEPGLPNVGVDLFGPGADGLVGTLDDVLRSSVTTDLSGAYLFSLVDAGVWQVRVRTNTVNPDFAPSYEYDGVLDAQTNVVLAGNQNRTDIDFGYVIRRVGDFVWEDANLNGLQDADEQGLDGVEIRLYRNGLFLFAVTRSGDNPATATIERGWYTFTGMPQGTYHVEVLVPAGFSLTSASIGNENRDSDFSALPAPNNGVVTTGISQTITIGSNFANTSNLDVGLIANKSFITIRGSLWFDENGDGLHQSLESPAFNTVELQQLRAGVWVVAASTQASPDYSFSVVPGIYRLKFPTRSGCSSGGLPPLVAGDSAAGGFGRFSISTQLGSSGGCCAAGAEAVLSDNVAAEHTGFGSFSVLLQRTAPVAKCWPLTLPFVGTNGAVDSNANVLDGLTAPFPVFLGDTFHDHLDAGYFPGFNLGDRVWLDSNGNGLQDQGETGVPGVTVQLHAQSPDGSFDPANTTTATTDSAGVYAFTSVPSAPYRISFVGDTSGSLPLRSFALTRYLGTNAADDSDLNPLTGFTAPFTPAGSDATLDIGLIVGTASLSGLVWSDVDGDGRQDGSDSESGLAGKLVRLVSDSGGSLVTLGTKLTNVDGKYTFDNLAPGRYRVEFASTDGDSRLTTQYVNGAPERPNDSNANAITGASEWFTLFDQAQQLNIDAGYVQSVSIGDFVWVDTNGNGKQDASEAGLSGVTVNLESPGPDGIYGYGWHLDNTSTFTTTDSAGRYRFTGLAPGSYRMKFPVAYTKAGVVYQLGTQTADLNSNGLESAPNSGTGEVAPRAFSPGSTLDSADAGYVAGNASIGDFVWFDRNGNGIQDGNDSAPEEGIYGVSLTLYATDTFGNNLIAAATTTTDLDGHYRFSNLAPGKYRVRYTLPAGYIQSPSDVNLSNGPLDSDFTDFDLNLGKNLSRLITVLPNERVADIDAGLAIGSTIGDRVWVDSNADGVQQVGEQGAPNVPVQLQRRIYPFGEQTFDPYWATTATMTTSLTGLYAFNGLPNGEYRIFVSVSLPIDGKSYVYSPSGAALFSSDSNLSPGGLSEILNVSGYTYRDDVDAGLIDSSSVPAVTSTIASSTTSQTTSTTTSQTTTSTEVPPTSSVPEATTSTVSVVSTTSTIPPETTTSIETASTTSTAQPTTTSSPETSAASTTSVPPTSTTSTVPQSTTTLQVAAPSTTSATSTLLPDTSLPKEGSSTTSTVPISTNGSTTTTLEPTTVATTTSTTFTMVTSIPTPTSSSEVPTSTTIKYVPTSENPVVASTSVGPTTTTRPSTLTDPPTVAVSSTLPFETLPTTTSTLAGTTTKAPSTTFPATLATSTTLPSSTVTASTSISTESVSSTPRNLVFAPVSTPLPFVGVQNEEVPPAETMPVLAPVPTIANDVRRDPSPLSTDSRKVMPDPSLTSSPAAIAALPLTAKPGTVGFLRKVSATRAKQALDSQAAEVYESLAPQPLDGSDPTFSSSKPLRPRKLAFVYVDLNNNGEPEDDERTLSGITVAVNLPSGLLVSVHTDANGQFSFAGLPDGIYPLTLVSGLPKDLAISVNWSAKTLIVAGQLVTQEVGFPVTANSGPDRLALTGAPSKLTAVAAVLLLAIGASFVLVARWRKRKPASTRSMSLDSSAQFDVTNLPNLTKR